jgi:dephospho-CoA kinase
VLRVGLTGGLGSGKSTAAAMFAALGVHLIEADQVGRELMRPGSEVFAAIVARFGAGVLAADGTLSRAALARLAFEGGRLEELNRIVHPAVIAAQERWMEELFAREPSAIAMVESALIFEAERSGTVPGWSRRFDCIVLVTAPEEVRIARYVARLAAGTGGEAAAAADARRRLAAQIPDSEKEPYADYILRNDGDLEHLRGQVAAAFSGLRERERRAGAEARMKLPGEGPARA